MYGSSHDGRPNALPGQGVTPLTWPGVRRITPPRIDEGGGVHIAHLRVPSWLPPGPGISTGEGACNKSKSVNNFVIVLSLRTNPGLP